MAGASQLPTPLRTRLAELVRQRGEHDVIADLGVHGATLARALAGLELRQGSIALIEQRLSRLTGE
jgi:hypothetical protein